MGSLSSKDDSVSSPPSKTISSMSKSPSLEGSVTSSLYSSARALVSSNSGLSWFDHPVDRQNCGIVVEYLKDLKLRIIAVWLVARPVQNSNGAFEHWCVKIQAKGALISIDFLEHHGKGAFGLQQHPDIGVQLNDFLIYKSVDKVTKDIIRKKWNIISSVTPSPFKNKAYAKLLAKHERFQLHSQINNSKLLPNDLDKFPTNIKCDKQVCDVANFCRLWYSDGKGYNAINKNCQQFAAELYGYLVEDNYPNKAKLAYDRYQSPYDKEQWKLKKSNSNDDDNGKIRKKRKKKLKSKVIKDMKSKPVIASIVNDNNNKNKNNIK